MSDRRKHFKAHGLPSEILDALNRRITEGYTYREVAAWLDERGHGISKSAVARYGKDFVARLERLKTINDQAKAIVENTEGLDMVAESAASRMALARIIEYLEQTPDMSRDKFASVIQALAKLQASSATRERLKMQYDGVLRDAVNEVKAELQAELRGHPELLGRLEEILERKLQDSGEEN